MDRLLALFKANAYIFCSILSEMPMFSLQIFKLHYGCSITNFQIQVFDLFLRPVYLEPILFYQKFFFGGRRYHRFIFFMASSDIALMHTISNLTFLKTHLCQPCLCCVTRPTRVQFLVLKQVSVRPWKAFYAISFYCEFHHERILS